MAWRQSAVRRARCQRFTAIAGLVGVLAAWPAWGQAPPDDDPLLSGLEESLRQAEWMLAQGVAATLCDVGQLDACIEEHEHALELCARAAAPELPRVRIETRLAVARAERQRGRLETARAGYEQALALIAAATAPPHDARLTADLGLANVLLEQGELDAARAIYDRAAAELTAAGRTRDVLAAELGLAAVAIVAGDQARADAVLTRAAPVAAGTDYEPYAVRLGAIADLSGRRWEAATAKLDALDALGMAALAKHFRDFADEDFHLSSLTQQKTDTELAVSLALAAGQPAATRLGLSVLLRRKGLVLDVVAARRRLLRNVVSPEIQEILTYQAEVGAELGALARQRMDPARDARIAELSDTRRTLSMRLQLRMQMLGDARPEARAFLRPALLEQRVDLAALQARLGGDEVLVELTRSRRYAAPAGESRARWEPARYVAFVLRGEGDPAVVDLGEAEPIDGLVRDLRGRIAAGDEVRGSARELYDRLLAPVRAAALGAGVMWLSPDGLLHLLPFDALLAPDGRHAIEHLALRYVTSGRDLLRPAVTPSASAPAATLLADPAFASGPAPAASAPRRRLVFPPLPGTAAEADRIARLLPGATVHRGLDASRAVLTGLRGPAILHVATHGFFLPETQGRAGSRGLTLVTGVEAPPAPASGDPLLQSGLALAGANVDDAGIVSASEMATLSLDGTRLAVLSACETGLGELRGGEGVFGLRRALVIAGSETQVLSLWAVDDDATATMMTGYYQRLLGGEDRHEALRQVRLGMLRQATTAHPSYWASFVVSGLDGPLVQPPAPAPPHPGRVQARPAGCGCHVGPAPVAPGAVALALCALAGLARRRRLGLTALVRIGRPGVRTSGAVERS